ncbi:MAG TPA: DUF4430 domain-containing protein [Clostridia bacterium]|nr:DUF4430 domain-containing protein [Clostridia bacterium]
MEKNIKNKRILAIVLGIIVVLVATLALVLTQCGPETVKGEKLITVEIVMLENDSKTVEIETDEEYLRGALEQENLIEGTESEYGLFVIAVDGVSANSANDEWWCITKGGESLMTGVDSTPIADGDNFEITLTVGY